MDTSPMNMSICAFKTSLSVTFLSLPSLKAAIPPPPANREFSRESEGREKTPSAARWWKVANRRLPNLPIHEQVR